MNNLKVGNKLILLTVILIGSLAFIGILAITQLSAQNRRIQEIGSQDFLNSQMVSDAHIAFQSAIRWQKNAVLAPTIKQSETFAATSRKEISKFESKVRDLEETSDTQTESTIGKLIDEFNQFKSINEECLNLAVLNSNLIGMELINSELREQGKLLVEYAQKSAKKTASEESAGPSKFNSVDLAAKLFQIHSLCVLHLNTSASAPEFPAIDRELSSTLVELSKLADDMNDDELPMEAVRKINSLVAEIVVLSKTDSNTKSTEISLNAAQRPTRRNLGLA
jgi:hypothetical protein